MPSPPSCSNSFIRAHHRTYQNITRSVSNDQETAKGIPINVHNPCLRKNQWLWEWGWLASWAKTLTGTWKNLPCEKLPPIPQKHSQNSKNVFQPFCMFEIFRDKMLNNNQKDKQRRWNYYNTLKNFNYKINLPIIDFYQHRRPQEKQGYKCQDWDGQRPARDHKHVNHVKIHSAL